MIHIPHRSISPATLPPILALLLLTACAKKRADSVAEVPSSPNTTVSAASSPESGTAAPIDTTAAEALTAELTQSVRKYAAEKQRVPRSLDDLTAAGYLPAVPAAPAGKKFAINKNLQVYLADQ